MGDTIVTRALFTGAVVAAVLLAGAFVAWGVDYGVAGTVIEKDRDAGGRFLVLQLDLGGIEVKHYLTTTQDLGTKVGNYVVYHVRSERVQVYQAKGGPLIYDSERSLRL